MKNPATLYFMCGKMGSGKSTLAKSLAADGDAVLLTEDTLLLRLFPHEVTDLASYVSCSTRLKNALCEHILGLLRHNLSVVLDFPANTLAQRAWFRQLIDASTTAHQLHFVDTPDEMCKAQLRGRDSNSDADLPLQDEATFDLLGTYFVAPRPEEGFTVVRHQRT